GSARPGPPWRTSRVRSTRCPPDGRAEGVRESGVTLPAVDAPRSAARPGETGSGPGRSRGHPSAESGRRRAARRRGSCVTPRLFLARGLALFSPFRVYPLLDGLYLSFTNARLGRTQHAFVGLANYERLLVDTRFHTSLWNTAYYTVASTLPIL